MGASQSFFLSRMNAQSSLITDTRSWPPSELALHPLTRGKRGPSVPVRTHRLPANATKASHRGDWRHGQIIHDRHNDGSGDVADAFSKLHPDALDRFELSRYERRGQE